MKPSALQKHVYSSATEKSAYEPRCDHFTNNLKCVHSLRQINDRQLEQHETTAQIISLFGGIRAIISHFTKTNGLTQSQYNGLTQILSELNPPSNDTGIIKPSLHYLPTDTLSAIAQYLNIIDLRTFQLVNFSFAVIGRAYHNTASARLHLSGNQRSQIGRLVHTLIDNNETQLIRELNNTNFNHSVRALEDMIEHGIIYKIFCVMKSKNVSDELRMTAINIIGKLCKYHHLQLYMNEFMHHRVIQSFVEHQDQYAFLTQSAVMFNNHWKHPPIWQRGNIRAYCLHDHKWTARGRGTIRIYDAQQNGDSVRLLVFQDETRKQVRLMQCINECSSYEYKQTSKQKFMFTWTGIDYTKLSPNLPRGSDDIVAEVFSLLFEQNEETTVLQLHDYFVANAEVIMFSDDEKTSDSESDGKHSPMPQDNADSGGKQPRCFVDDEMMKFHHVNADNIFSRFYWMPHSLQKSVLQIFSEDVNESMHGLQYLRQCDSEWRKLHDFMIAGIARTNIQLCQSQDDKVRYQAVAALSDIAKAVHPGAEPTSTHYLFDAIKVLHKLFLRMHDNLRNSDDEKQQKDLDMEDGDNLQLSEAVIRCIGRMSVVFEYREEFHRYHVYQQIIDNVLSYPLKLQSVAALTIANISDGFYYDYGNNPAIVSSVKNVAFVLFELFKSANEQQDIRMTEDVLYSLGRYVYQYEYEDEDEDEAKTVCVDAACADVVESGFFGHLFDYVCDLLVREEPASPDCLRHSLDAFNCVFDQTRIWTQKPDTVSVSAARVVFQCLTNQRYVRILSYKHIWSGVPLAHLWMISQLLTGSECRQIIDWIFADDALYAEQREDDEKAETDEQIEDQDKKQNSVLRRIVELVQCERCLSSEELKEAHFIVTSLVQQIVNSTEDEDMVQRERMEVLIASGIVEAIFVMMKYPEYIVECMYCMESIYRLAPDAKDISSRYVKRLDELLNDQQSDGNIKFDETIVRKLKSTKQRFLSLLRSDIYT